MRFTVRLFYPLNGGANRPLIPSFAFDSLETAITFRTSIAGGFHSLEVGYPVMRGGQVVPAYLANPIDRYVDYAHVEVYAGATLVWEGRTDQPTYRRGQIVGFKALGYWSALDDAIYDSSDTTDTPSGTLLHDVVSFTHPHLSFGNSEQYGEPGVNHTPAEISGANGTPAGQIAEQIRNEGGTDGYRWDVLYYEGPALWLKSRMPPAVPDYAVAWDDTVDLQPDSALNRRGAVTVVYTDATAGTADATSEAESTTFEGRYGFQRGIILEGGTLSDTAANQYRDVFLAEHEKRRWAGTITRENGAGLELFRGGLRSPWFVRAGEWALVKGCVDEDNQDAHVLHLITETEYSHDGETERLTVKIGDEPVSGADLFRNVRGDLTAFRAKRNPLTGAAS